MLWELILTPVDHLFPSSNSCAASGSCGVLCATDTWKSSAILSTNDTSILRSWTYDCLCALFDAADLAYFQANPRGGISTKAEEKASLE